MFKKVFTSMIGSTRAKKIEAHLKTELLGKVLFLKGADEQLFSDLAAAIESVKYSKGETIFREGEPGESFFLIAEGAVEVTCQGEAIAELGVGGCFGEGALLDDNVRGATVLATEDVELFELTRKSYIELTEKYKKVRYRLKQLHDERRAEGIEKSIQEKLLKNAPFLADAGGDLISEMAQFLEAKNYAEGDELIREGAEGTCFFLVEEGIVGIRKGDTQIAELGPGACIGEGALLSNRTCSATVIALTETACFILSKGAFNRIIGRYTVFGSRLKAIHAERHKS